MIPAAPDRNIKHLVFLELMHRKFLYNDDNIQ